ncbi:hypothetical protein J4421_00710 [Candidatus Woesearchaeota archaeon]|nr:hypothetical protein [Candidatus Woesearchaeota archaeon]
MKAIKIFAFSLGLIFLFLAGCHENFVSLIGYAVAPLPPQKGTFPQVFVSCPSSFTNQGCIWGNEAIINFRPLFQVWSVPENELVGARMIFGKPECIYQKKGGTNVYRLQGKVIQGGNCVAQERGFWCER